jgi:hypothetical protein
MGRAKLKTLKETTLLTLFEVAQIWEGEISLMLNNAQGRITVRFYTDDGEGNQVPAESYIFLKDLFLYPSDPEFVSLGSLEITGAFIDEANEVSWKAVQVVRSRIRYKLDEFGLTPKLLCTCNPSKGWTFENFYKPHKDGSIKQNRRFVKALATDNPWISPHYLKNLEDLDDNTLKQRLLYGNWEYDDTEGILMLYDRIIDMFDNQYTPSSPRPGERFISADIAEQGSDKFVAIVWYGWRVVEVVVHDKTEYKQMEEILKGLATRHRVPRTNMVYDRDGVGGFLSSYLRNAREFRNGAAPVYMIKRFKEDFQNLKSQCYYHLARKINDGEVALPGEKVGKYKEDIIEELSVVRNVNVGTDNKIKVQPKEVFKQELGRSPDFADALMMRSIFDIKPAKRMGRRAN